MKHLPRHTIASSISFAFLSALIKTSVMDLAAIRETESWRFAAVTNQLYVGRARSGTDGFTAPAILMERDVLHRAALAALFPSDVW